MENLIAGVQTFITILALAVVASVLTAASVGWLFEILAQSERETPVQRMRRFFFAFAVAGWMLILQPVVLRTSGEGWTSAMSMTSW